ncbi:hypothetical protein C7446_1814 [Kushneria sinocarnis]|uniref:Uncharacterized protein n=1 Tax=Kushneria sinocarnis TaxID=595502 RepID=A0A420WW26_9GAMM|nr:hypothetical protein [Kushneria sinocarnis]RKR03293.1 hypothetical protein C7446_1814 [Kushneria sinocarnis]
MMILEPVPACTGTPEGSDEALSESTLAELCWQQLCLESGCPASAEPGMTVHRE